ncbi:hypothetical protein F5B20DRAFT_575116 [Whalleya microplaca]|nr:hypothetical protein F5B20DRAFT_575116 [Whalleya microplaca]
MASSIRLRRLPLTSAPSSLLRTFGSSSSRITATSLRRIPLPPTSHSPPGALPPRTTAGAIAPFHTTSPRRAGDAPQHRSPTNFGALDVLGNVPVPASSVDVCMSDGFQLNSGAKILDGAGVLLVGGEPFRWRPWLARGNGGKGPRLLNARGQWDVPNETFGLLGLIWPRPDLLILGLGPDIRPLSPELRKHISSLGMKVEILDTRNAAAQFNLLATERGVNDVAAALIPIGWKEGVGAVW